jgi:hypothetical protein
MKIAAICELSSGKSTQNAFMLRPYKKLAKLSLNLDRLSCISCKCMKFASKSAIESDNSANAGSNASRGVSDAPPTLDLPDSRKDDREDGRRGVVGRDVGRRDLEPGRFMPLSRIFVEEDIVNEWPGAICLGNNGRN